ncbi:MAG: hypothetical protein ACFE0S_06220 [Rhodospirillales bacterium]
MTVVQERPKTDQEMQSLADPDLQNDLDLFHVLPLAGLPLQSPALSKARMIKSQNLDTMIEVFRDQLTGSGQIAIGDLDKQFGDQLSAEDVKLLKKLGRLNSYDPFSLRITLRDLELLTDGMMQVNLSEQKQQELEKFMQSFTRPLIQQVFGDEETDIEKFEDIVSVFKDPDAEKVRRNLGKLAAQLKIEILDIPKFLEDFSDVFLSLSYYRDTIDLLEPKLALLNDSLNNLRSGYQFTQDRSVAQSCEDTVDRVNRVFIFVTGRLESFAQSTENLWENMTAENFEKVRTLISSYHVSLGGMLCALSVKLNAWGDAFPNADVGSPARRIEFLRSEMRRGIDRIDTIFDETPALANFNTGK